MISSPAANDCLIGGTGFVGGALLRQRPFADRYNSRDIGGIAGRAYDAVVCAAAPGSMFEANKFPDRDREKVEALCDQLRGVSAERFVLISSIAVLEDFAGEDDEGSERFQQALAYGRHRRMLETFCAERFPRCLIVRLPALFGPGLRKNFIFDLMNPMPSMLTEAKLADLRDGLGPDLAAAPAGFYAPDAATGMLKLNRAAYDASPLRPALDAAVTEFGASAVQFHNPQTTYQYYDIMRLWDDVEIALEAGLEVIHMATEPLRADRIHQRLTGRPMPSTGARPHHEDMRTRHAGLWGREGGYLEDADAVLDRLAAFFGG
ncbi:MAG: hypothetical protein CML46_07040 [Rhodobacteraceae bacterium]|nr:hypothetical protein [Paracoccaceae bacterium]MBR26682.1 hypothetical protein [Paracoccaceae bacterium]